MIGSFAPAISHQTSATIEKSKMQSEVFRQHFITDVRQRQQEARAKVNASRPDGAVVKLRTVSR